MGYEVVEDEPKTCFTCDHFDGDKMCGHGGFAAEVDPNQVCTEWKEKNAVETNKKPRICEILGVDVGEKFKIRGYSDDVVFEIDEDGEYITHPPAATRSSFAFMGCIECPERVEKLPCFMDNESMLMKILYDYNQETSVKALSSCVLVSMGDNEQYLFPKGLFPPLESGRGIKLRDFLG